MDARRFERIEHRAGLLKREPFDAFPHPAPFAFRETRGHHARAQLPDLPKAARVPSPL
jgi:hypothetical protein